MIVVQVPFNDEVREVLWPSFKKNIEDKHSTSGAVGIRGETNALKLIETYFSYDVCYDHSQDIVGQLFGIDFTLVSKHGSYITVDVKSGASSLYWDRDEKYWYINLKPELFEKKKKNTHIMHVGPKGDLFALYNRKKMYNEYTSNTVFQSLLIEDSNNSRLKQKDWPSWVLNNIGKNSL